LTILARLVATVAFIALLAPAQSEEVVVTVAPAQIAISSSYSGGTVVVFGAVVQKNLVRLRPYDVAVIVTGPRQTIVTRRKGRIAGVWVNQESSTFYNVPSFLGVLSNRPLKDIAGADVLRRQGIGLKNALFDGGVRPDSEDPFLVNFINIRSQQRLFDERSGGVTFLSQTAFRAEIPLPDNVPIGDYQIDLKLFQNGEMLGEAMASFTVVKIGVEDFVVNAATNHTLLYGVTVVSMALMAGWLASIVFRRDRT
jgi:uncharacterized protein (TIGR02186 family)